MQENAFIINTGPISLEEVEVKGTKKDYIKGFISTDDLDLVNDIVTQKCFDSMISQLKDRTIKLDFEHEAFRGDSDIEMEINKTKVPLAKRVDWQRKSNGVEVTWEMNPTWKQINSKGDIINKYEDIKYNLKNGFYDAFSICFIPSETRNHKIDGKDVRLLDDLNLLNVALTGNAVNPKAQVSEIFVKSLDYAKNNSQLDDKSIKLNEEKMPEDEKTEKQEETQESENSEKPQEGEKPTESKGKEDEDKKPLKKSDDDSEKEDSDKEDLKEEVKSLRKELAEVKALLKKPIHKGRESDKKESEAKSVQSSGQGPLDRIC